MLYNIFTSGNLKINKRERQQRLKSEEVKDEGDETHERVQREHDRRHANNARER